MKFRNSGSETTRASNGGSNFGKPPKRDHIEICDSRTDLGPGNWTSWGKQATKERPQNSNQSPVPNIRVSHTQVTKHPQSKPNQKGKGYPQPGSTMNGTPRQPVPGRSLFLLRHLGDRRGPATLIRGCDGSKLEPIIMASHTPLTRSPSLTDGACRLLHARN